MKNNNMKGQSTPATTVRIALTLLGLWAVGDIMVYDHDDAQCMVAATQMLLAMAAWWSLGTKENGRGSTA